MSKCTISRRALVAGTASLPIATTSVLAAVVPDPIFAAIERHKIAFRFSQVAGRIQSKTVDAEWSPDYDPVVCEAVQEDASAADNANAAAANALTTIRPTTMAGLLALIHHVEAFNAGAFFLEPDSPESTVDDWRSKAMFWPESNDDDAIDLFGYAVLANVRRSLEAMAMGTLHKAGA